MIKSRANAEHYTWGEVCDGWRLLDRQDLSVIQERIPPGSGEVRHYHARARQLFFVLEGELTIDVNEGQFQLKPQGSLEVVPGDQHSVRNGGDGDAIFLVISTPTTRGDRINL